MFGRPAPASGGEAAEIWPEEADLAKRLSVMDAELCVGCQSCMYACTRRGGTGGTAGACIGVRSAGGIRRGFVVVVCRACPDPPCSRVCPVDALPARPGGGVRLREDECIACGNCVKACPFGAIFWEREINKPQVCVYCGTCARYCPYGVIQLTDCGEVDHAAR